MRNAGLDEAQTGIKIDGRNINNLRYADDTTLMAESEEELKSLLKKVKRGEWNVTLKSIFRKLGSWHQYHHLMANRWGNNRNSDRLYFWGSRITADGDCSHEIKRHLLLGRKAMTNLDREVKSRDITLPTKVRLVKAMVFPAVMYGRESWTTRKPEHWRTDAFELVLENTLKSPLDCKGIKAVHPKGNHSWIFIARIDSEAETDTLVTWCKELAHWKTPWCWERLKAVSLMRQDLVVSKLVLLWLFLIERGKTDGNSMKNYNQPL